VVASVILSFVMVVVGGAQIIAAGSLGVTVLGLDYNVACISLGIAFIIYTLAGGMSAVSATNTMHIFVMYGGVILALFLVRADLGGSYQSLSVALPAVPYFSWFGIGVPKVTSWIIASILGACTAQAGIQPLLAAKDVITAKRAAITTACVVAPFGICTAFLGMCAKAKFPALASGKLALPTLMMDMNPIAGGLVLASVTAAILSTVSPIILASGTMITKDIYHRVLRPDAKDSEVLRFSRIATGISGLLCIAIAMIPNIRILDMVYFAYTLRGSIFVIILFGIYHKGTTSRGAVWAMIATAIVGLAWVAYKSHFNHYPIHPAFTETYAAVIVATVLTPMLSKIMKDEPEGIRKA